MRFTHSILGAAALWATTALSSWAADYALILTNRDYDRVSTATDAVSYDSYAGALQQQGFRVFGGESWNAWNMARAANDFQQALASGQVDRVVVVLSGRMAEGPTDGWLLARDYGQVTSLNVGQYAMSVNALADVLGDYPGKALMLISASRPDNTPVGAGLVAGAVVPDLPQGVTAMQGRAERMLPVLRDQILQSRVSLAQLAQIGQGITFQGYVSDQPLGATSGPAVDSESAYWSAARDIGTIEAYRAYLSRFPRGMYVNEARRMIEDILQHPNREAEADEAALNLSRDARREIQRQLTLLGFDTRGIDGIFGAGTRTAIVAYQRSKGWIETGYVNNGQLETLRQDALRRARELEEEERRRRAEEERRDRDFWATVGARGDEASLREYLRRFPDGIFSDEARARLDEYDLRRRRDADYRMRVAWDEARTADTISAYRRFLAQYPESDFAPTARARIEELDDERKNADQIEKDKAEEAVVAGNPITRLLVENTLRNRGFDPGNPDGEFDKATRKAIRQFQRASQLPVTGYVSQATMVRLLSR